MYLLKYENYLIKSSLSFIFLVTASQEKLISLYLYHIFLSSLSRWFFLILTALRAEFMMLQNYWTFSF